MLGIDPTKSASEGRLSHTGVLLHPFVYDLSPFNKTTFKLLGIAHTHCKRLTEGTIVLGRQTCFAGDVLRTCCEMNVSGLVVYVNASVSDS